MLLAWAPSDIAAQSGASGGALVPEFVGQNRPQQPTCGGIYVVEPGDTLRYITISTLGHDNYRLVFEANRGALRTPGLLEVGDPLFIPCPDGRGASSRSEALSLWNASDTGAGSGRGPDPEHAVSRRPGSSGAGRAATFSRSTDRGRFQPSPPTAQATGDSAETRGPDAEPSLAQPEPSLAQPGADLAPTDLAALDPNEVDGYPPKVRFLTGSDFAPFSGEELPDGGMITELIRLSMRETAPGRDFRITFVNDWAPHLDPLLMEGAFDLGFPWYKPNCDHLDRLSASMRLRCTDFDFSHALYEVVIGYYMRSDDVLATSVNHAALLGKRICRPRGYFTFDLEAEGLNKKTVTMISATTAGDCFELLADGEVDVVSVNVLLAEKELAEQELHGHVVENPDLNSIQTLHALSPKANPFGRTYLTLINRGLRRLRESGEWFEVVTKHLARHADRLR